jgi:hypothetical protein
MWVLIALSGVDWMTSKAIFSVQYYFENFIVADRILTI